MNSAIAQIEEIFSLAGALAKNIPGYSPRAIQLEMAIAITKALEQSNVLIAEAGTGTGKTYAYLIPCLISGKKVIVSTGTKNLQDQLFHRDIPLLRKILGRPIKVALLKGRGNYVCLHRLNTYLQTRFINSEFGQKLFNIKNWVESSRDGEIEHIKEPQPDSRLLPYITSTADNCLGQDCEYFSKCYLLKARREAQEVDLLIVNHHLFFADSQLKDVGITELLPDVDAVIFDEAHQLHEIATHFLGQSVSGRQFIYLARDIHTQRELDAPDMLELKEESDKLINATGELQKAFGSACKGTWGHIFYKPEIKAGLENLENVLTRLEKILELASVRGRGLENCWRRTVEMTHKLKELTILSGDKHIHWYEVQDNNFVLYHTPMDISDYFQRLIQGNTQTWIFTSATLSVNGDFSHFESQLGLANTTRLHLNSPFDYQKQALLYLPPLQVFPNEEGYVKSMLEFVIPVLRRTEGRAFFLFTSHRTLKEASIQLADQIEYPLLIQGSASKSQLLKTFCELDHAILLGTSSFWEGVDVKGKRLSCVIIDKIPFLSPDDPILKTRFEYLKKQGRNPFQDYQLPQAVISLRQGVGRLIRDQEDYGILVLCDPRLTAKEYGKIFIDSLPPMPMTQSFDEVQTFLEDLKV